MASRPSFSNNTRIIMKPLPVPVPKTLLQDYLLDDMSSCSSNGFRSYPRRQCCTTVRFLVESDLTRHPKRSNLKPKQLSMLQKASAAMIKTFKRLPFAGARVSTKAKLLPRSLSRKLVKHGLWINKSNKCIHNTEAKRLKSFGDLLKETEITPPSSTAVNNAIATASNSNSNSSKLSDSTQSVTTSNTLEVNLAQNDVLDGVGVTTITATAVTATNYSDTTEDVKKWRDNHDEQFSPVSVMDFPNDNDNDDEDDEVSSMSQHKHLNVKGAQISTQKTRASRRVPQLEPVKLEDRIAQSLIKHSTIENQIDFALEDNQTEKKATALLQLLKSTVSYRHLLQYEGVKCLLLEFFKENALEENVSDYEILQRAKYWMDEQQQEVFIDWECENIRQAYLRDMEKGVKWSNYDHQVEKVNVGLEVECEIFESLVNEVLIELMFKNMIMSHGY